MSRILYSQSNAFGQITKTSINSIITAKLNFSRLVPVLNAMVVIPGDYSGIEAQLGIVAGQGQAFYNTIVGMQTAINAVVGLDTLDIGN